MFFKANFQPGGREGNPFMATKNKKTMKKGKTGSRFRTIKSDDLSPSKPEIQTTETEEQAMLSAKGVAEKYEDGIAKIFDMDGDDLGGLEEGRKTKLEFQKLQIMDFSVTLVAMIGAYVTVLAYDVEFDQQDKDLLLTLLWVVFVSTKVAIVLDVFRYLQKIKYHKARNLLTKKDNLFSSGEIWNLSIEIFILLLQPYPFINSIPISAYEEATDVEYYYYVNDLFAVFIVARVYLICRVILNATVYRSPRARRLSTLYGADNDYLYAYKCVMLKAPFLSVTVLLGASIFIFGYMIRICERPLIRSENTTMDMSTYWNSMWCTILTMTTVGYGDYFPRTHFGRIITFLCCIWGVFVVSLVVVTLTSILAMSIPEQKALLVLERLQLRHTLREEAANVLTNMTKVSLNNRKKGVPSKVIEEQNRKLIRKIKMNLNEFRTHSRQIRGLDDSGNIEEEMTRQFKLMRDDIKEMKSQQQNLQLIVVQLGEMLENKITSESINRLPDVSIGRGINILPETTPGNR